VLRTYGDGFITIGKVIDQRQAVKNNISYSDIHFCGTQSCNFVIGEISAQQ